MEFKKPNSEAVSKGAALIGGGALGAMVSRGVIGAFHTPTTSTDAKEIAKDANKLLMYRGALLIVAAAGAVATTGNDVVTSLAKGALSGMAIMQTVEIVKEYASKSPSLAETTTGTKRFIAKTLGLACGCSDNAMPMNETMHYGNAMNGISRRRALRSVEVTDEAYPVNALDVAYQNGVNA